METSSYLFNNKRKIFHKSSKIMSKQINDYNSSSNLSVDSLEDDFKRKNSIKDSEDNVDTILVPFYEKDVLMKVPKEQKNKSNKQGRSTDRLKRETPNSSYLVNNHKHRRNSYLEMFRKQLTPLPKVKKPVEHEIRSLSPEVGDTEIESINEDPNNAATEFFNTESYNEIYYEKLMTHDLENYFDHSYEEIQYLEDTEGSPPHDINIKNLRSVSEVSQPRQKVRRSTGDPPLDNVKLGGLGPDMERIKPRMDRARSLQRYSEKVRMENRLKIYKKSVQAEKDKRVERDISGSRQRNPGPEKEQRIQKDDTSASYLMNKSSQPNSSQVLSKLYSKSKSADPMRRKAVTAQQPILPWDKLNRLKNENKQAAPNDKRKSVPEATSEGRTKSGFRNRGVNTERARGAPPVHINFMVNVGGVRPTSALKTLEEKHRMYQEQVKGFKIDNNNL